MVYNVSFEMCSLVFLFMLIIITLSKHHLEDFQSVIFRAYLYGAAADIILSIVTCYTDTYYDRVPIWLNYVLNTLFLSMQCLIPTMMMMYVYMKIQEPFRNKRRVLVAFIPAIVGVVLNVSTFLTKAIFYIDDTGYHHGNFHLYLYVNAGIYTIITIVYAVASRKFLTWGQTAAVAFMIITGILPTVIQFFFPNYMLAGVGMTLSVFIMYFTSENLASYVDPTTNALNREAFSFQMENDRDKGRLMQIFVLALDNFKIINEIYGMSGGNEVMKKLVNALQREYSNSSVFRIGGDTFAVALEEKTEAVMELEVIRRVLNRPMHIHGIEIELSACICLVHTIHHEHEELLRAIDYAVAQAKTKGKGQFFEVNEEVAGDMLRRAAIEQAMITAIEAGHFEVHYQPIFDTHNKCFHSMEALARLNVPGYGYVSPEEFIRIAEQNGTVVQIGILVLEEVCRFIKQYNLKQKGIRFVEVNLSVVQCMQEKIYKDILEVLDKYQIPPSMINLEITESAAAYSEERLVRNMARMSLADITFSLDDYGSGYSNVQYLVDLPFSIVKVDKYIVWAAMKKVSSRNMLAHTIAMFKDINLKVVTEGIEDLEMAEIVTAMGADYLQGYYFSKPVPKEKLVECLEEGYLEKLYTKNA